MQKKICNKNYYQAKHVVNVLYWNALKSATSFNLLWQNNKSYMYVTTSKTLIK